MWDWIMANGTSLIGPAVVAAVISGTVAVIGFVITSRNARSIHREKIAADKELSERKISADITLAKRKFDFDGQLAERKILLDIQLVARKRQTDLAEQVLADFYRVRDVFIWARNSGSSGSEGNSRPRLDNENHDTANFLDVLYIPIERLGKERELFARIHANQHRFTANFGAVADEAFIDIRTVHNKIMNASSFAISMERKTGFQRDTAAHADLLNRMHATIWAGMEEPDTIAATVDKAVAVIEALCVPILRDQNHGSDSLDLTHLPLTATKI